MAASSCTIVGEMERTVSAKILFTKNRYCACDDVLMIDDDDDDDMIKDISIPNRYYSVLKDMA